MSRNTYPLSDETLRVLSSDKKAFAEAFPCNESYVYQILSNVEPDPFPKFRFWRATALRAGIDITPWDAVLSADKAKHEAEEDHSITSCLMDKQLSHTALTNGLINALTDGRISESEKKAISEFIAAERDNLNELERAINSDIAHIRQFANKAVNGRRK